MTGGILVNIRDLEAAWRSPSHSRQKIQLDMLSAHKPRIKSEF